jgi:hypothetical protein
VSDTKFGDTTVKMHDFVIPNGAFKIWNQSEMALAEITRKFVLYIQSQGWNVFFERLR